jgi:geranylgeranyl diphosphate synthase type II
VTHLQTSSLSDYLQSRRELIEAALDTYLPHPPAVPLIIHEAMRYSLFAGGKRLRPILTLATAETVAERGTMEVGLASKCALPAACALEMIHTYSLIHDDLPAMDNDSLRRGRATLHIVYNDGIAILAGDGLLTEAFALLAREPESAHDETLTARKLRVVATIAAAAGAAGMVGGQAIDLHMLRSDSRHDREALDDMHRRKTGALIRAAAVAGAIMSGGSDELIGAIDHYATHLGLAFQIVDDILDVAGVSNQLGKTAGKDAAAGKLTYPVLYGLEESRRTADRCLEQATATLASVGLAPSRLCEIATWVVKRRN